MINERQRTILQWLGQNDRMTVKALSSRLGVSMVTIRQDLNFLESEGLLQRIHGGATLRDADVLADRLGINYEKKLNIARKLASLVNDGETILIESGSVNVLLAREMMKKNKVTIITTNVFIAREFRKNEGARIILPGGIYQHDSESLVGKITRLCIDQLNFEKAFIGIDGYTADTGFTSRDLMRAEVSAHIISRSQDIYIVSDSSKFGKKELTNICYLKDVHHIATDGSLPGDFRNEFMEAGIDLIIA